ncbi:MAG TPA: xanthine dehydrogenase family protein subunit M [Ktedonobacteraceae bacterium]|nr:xanthine dehydrogenase family protein subunit M [Ktedonobacteraceae bacterium]
MLKIAAYHSPTTLAEAVALLVEEGSTVIAGGTDLLVNPRYMVGVREVVDIRKLGLDYISLEHGWLQIGAGATMRTVARHPQVQALANGILARGAAVCGSPNIRNMATLVGNVASALPSADTPPALLALDAQVVLVGVQGEHVVPLDGFFVGPARSIRERELIRELRIPLAGASGLHGGFYKIGRTAEDISMVNAVATLAIGEGVITAARLVLGAVAPVPLRIVRAEGALIGQPASEETFQRVAEIVRDEVRPISDQRASADYRRRMSGVAAVRALRQAAGLAAHGEEWHHA